MEMLSGRWGARVVRGEEVEVTGAKLPYAVNELASGGGRGAGWEVGGGPEEVEVTGAVTCQAAAYTNASSDCCSGADNEHWCVKITPQHRRACLL